MYSYNDKGNNKSNTEVAIVAEISKQRNATIIVLYENANARQMSSAAYAPLRSQKLLSRSLYLNVPLIAGRVTDKALAWQKQRPFFPGHIRKTLRFLFVHRSSIGW